MTRLTQGEFEAVWADLEREAQASKFSEQATLRLLEFYGKLEADDRATVDAVLADWVVEGSSVQRYDALALIDKFQIRSALPALKEHRARLENAVGPSAPYDRAKLHRIIAHLEEDDCEC